MTDTYKVIQADRDMAAAWLVSPFMSSEKLAEAFAKYREDTEALIVGWLRTCAQGAANDYAQGFAFAIEAGDHHTNNTPGG